jgi:threonine synthase
MWRYQEILPLLESEKGLDAPVALGEGWTPLVRARRLGKALGLSRVFIKDESRNPTGSFEARGMSAAITRLVHLGVRVAAVSTTGESGPALAAYAARGGIEAKVFVTSDASAAAMRATSLYGADVTTVEGDASDAARMAAERGQPHGWYHLSSFAEAYRVEGKKTLAYELAEQLDWQVPDWIVCPTGGGTGLVALWKGFAEMAALGWIDPIRRPHLVCVQAAGCAPIVRAFGSNAERVSPWENPHTLAAGLRVPNTPGDFLVLRALRENAGTAMASGDTEMVAEMKEVAKLEGLSVSPESGAALHALRVLAGEGRIKAHDTIVVCSMSGAASALETLEG